MIDWAERNHRPRAKDVAFNFPTTRRCDCCGEKKQRSSGRWMNKDHWHCFDCKKRETND